MQAVAKILRARASKHLCNFCEQFEQRPNFASTFKLNGTIRYPFSSMACFHSTFSTLQSLLRNRLIPQRGTSCNILVFHFDLGSICSLPLIACLQAPNLGLNFLYYMVNKRKKLRIINNYLKSGQSLTTCISTVMLDVGSSWFYDCGSHSLIKLLSLSRTTLTSPKT